MREIVPLKLWKGGPYAWAGPLTIRRPGQPDEIVQAYTATQVAAIVRRSARPGDGR